MSQLNSISIQRELTWISEVEVVLNVADVFGLSVLNPVSVGFLVVANKNAKQDDHGCLPHKANCREADPHVGVFGAVTQVPEALNAAHGLDLLWGPFEMNFLLKISERTQLSPAQGA